MSKDIVVSENPFGAVSEKSNTYSGAMVDVEGQRAIAETQAAMAIAKRFPRNHIEAMDRIINSCTRHTLAERALYEYARGGTSITGPSIRLAEAIAQNWGNIDFGIKELEQRDGESTVMAYAHDLETNTRQVKIFQVAHQRHTKKGSYELKDPRDIYELVANQGARRLRACILGVIPGDVVEVAQKQCEETLTAKINITPEKIKSMESKFLEIGVTKEMIENNIQKRLESITPALMLKLGKIFNSIKDGMSSASDWFDVPKTPKDDLDSINDAFTNKQGVSTKKPKNTDNTATDKTD